MTIYFIFEILYFFPTITSIKHNMVVRRVLINLFALSQNNYLNMNLLFLIYALLSIVNFLKLKFNKQCSEIRILKDTKKQYWKAVTNIVRPQNNVENNVRPHRGNLYDQ